MQHKRLRQILADSVGLADEPLPGLPIIELAGDYRVLIERHNGVTEYRPGRICVRVSYGLVRICGCDLQLTQMSRSQLVVSGRIDCVQLERRG